MSNSQPVTEIISDLASRVFYEEKLATEFGLTPESIEKFNYHLGKFLAHIEATDKRNTGDNKQKNELIVEVRYNLPKQLELIPQIYVDGALRNKISEAINAIRIHAIARVEDTKVINQHGIEVTL